jgi:hypothetical protein
VATPDQATLRKLWKDLGEPKTWKHPDSDGEEGPWESTRELISSGLFTVVKNPWEMIEWAFFQSRGGWIDLMNHLMWVLRDFDGVRIAVKEQLEKDRTALQRRKNDDESEPKMSDKDRERLLSAQSRKMLDECLLVQWLCNSRGTAKLTEAVRAIIATPGMEMMLDNPKPIYDSPAEEEVLDASAEKEMPDMWGGNIMLHHRIDLASMVCPRTFHIIVDI